MDVNLFTGMVLLAISMFSAFSAVMLIGRRKPDTARVAALPRPISRLAGNPGKTVFLFAGTRLVDATPGALLFIEAPVDKNAVWQRLQAKLEPDFPGACDHLGELAKHDTEFDLFGDSSCLLSGRVDDGQIRIELAALDASPAPVSIEQAALGNQVKELARLREIVELSPMLVWRQAIDGSISWANKAYLDLLTNVHPNVALAQPPYPAMLEQVTPDQTSTSRQSLKLPGQPRLLWFEVRSSKQESGEILNFAFHANPVVQAEEALRNFVQTLTKTFAHLPIGLAIFDRDRQLALFNPALADLTTLEPAWLTARPTLTAFLDRLRENRHVPEPKNYKTWRDRIAALEKAAEDGTYEENWPLPTGQTYKITGRPHPEGAVAFLFEDITSSISLQRQFRSELELGQSVLDSLTGAVAVFSANGDLVMSNDGFAETWGIDPREMLAQLSIREITQTWQAACDPSPIWSDLLTFADTPRDRAQWGGHVRLKTGDTLHLQIKPLARGAFLCEFAPEMPLIFRASQETLAQA